LFLAQERRDLLHKHFTEVEGEFSFAKGVDGTTTEEIQEALEESIKGKKSTPQAINLNVHTFLYSICNDVSVGKHAIHINSLFTPVLRIRILYVFGPLGPGSITIRSE
jgi:hypothetical protein